MVHPAPLQIGSLVHRRSLWQIRRNLNAFAPMAINFNDYVVADAVFKGIEQWDEDTWRTRQYFDGNREYAAKIGPMQARSRKEIQEAIASQQSPSSRPR